MFETIRPIIFVNDPEAESGIVSIYMHEEVDELAHSALDRLARRIDPKAYVQWVEDSEGLISARVSAKAYAQAITDGLIAPRMTPPLFYRTPPQVEIAQECSPRRLMDMLDRLDERMARQSEMRR